jgi:hypothetical protein
LDKANALPTVTAYVIAWTLAPNNCFQTNSSPQPMDLRCRPTFDHKASAGIRKAPANRCAAFSWNFSSPSTSITICPSSCARIEALPFAVDATADHDHAHRLPVANLRRQAVDVLLRLHHQNLDAPFFEQFDEILDRSMPRSQ